MKVKTWLQMTVAALAVAAGGVYAQPYVGGGGGYTTASIPTTTTATIVSAATGAPAWTSVNDNNDWGYKVFAGFDINQYAAAELGYTNFGQFGTTTTTTIPSAVLSKVQGTAWYFDGIGKLPIGNGFSAYARLGLTWWDMQNKIQNIIKLEDMGWSWKGGLGGQYDLNKNFAFRAEWERYQNMGSNTTTGKVDVNLFNAQVLYKF